MSQQLTGRNIIIYLAMKYEGEWNRIYEAIKQKELVSYETVQETLNTLKSRVVTIVDEDYPEILKKTYKPPFVLFYYGNLNLLNHAERLLSVIDVAKTNNLSSWMQEISNHYTVVRTYSQGDKAIEPGNVYVMDQGIDSLQASNPNLYEVVKSKGLILSEYPNLTIFKDPNGPFSFRILSSLGHSLLVNGLTKKSKETIAIGYTMYLSKNIFCANPKEKPNIFIKKLIKDGAIEVKNPYQLIQTLKATEEKHSNYTA
jgi:DNA processing protein